MKPIGGMNLDASPLNQPKDTTRYAENVLLSEETGTLENVPGERLLADNLPASNTVVGVGLGRSLIYYFCSVNTGGGTVWSLDSNENLTQLFTDTSDFLDLKEEANNGNKIKLVFQSDFESHDVFAWASNDFKPKIIDIGKVVEDLGAFPVDLNSLYVKSNFLLFPEAPLYNPIASVINRGGNLKSGAYTFFYRYVLDDLSTTSFSGASSTVYVCKDDESDYFGFNGDEGNI
jgi:hypothetical protein